MHFSIDALTVRSLPSLCGYLCIVYEIIAFVRERMCLCAREMCVCACVCAYFDPSPGKSVGFLIAGVTDGYELSNVGTGKCTWVLWKWK